MGFLVGVVLLGGLIAAGVWWAQRSKEADERHRQEMRDLVMGRTGRAAPAVAPVAEPAIAPEPRPVRRPALDPSVAEKLRRENMGRPQPAPLAEVPPKSTPGVLPREPTHAELQRVQRVYQKAIDDADAFNRRGASRPTDTCWLQISYVDADGVWTSRNVAPYKSGNTNEKFDAWCETRESRRTFFFSRVQAGGDTRTGRHLSRRDVFQLIHPERRVPASVA